MLALLRGHNYENLNKDKLDKIIEDLEINSVFNQHTTNILKKLKKKFGQCWMTL